MRNKGSFPLKISIFKWTFYFTSQDKTFLLVISRISSSVVCGGVVVVEVSMIAAANEATHNICSRLTFAD